MELWQSIALGAIQGLAEFLPISSSGHLTLFQKIYGLADASMTLEILLHVGTLLAVFVVYWRKIWNMICHPLASDLKWLVLATIPAVLAALFLGDIIDKAFEGAYLGFCFLMTSAVLLIAEAISKLRTKRHKQVTWVDAAVMGCMQAVAILPGLSRSGSTLAGGLASGLNRRRAADFSFLMSIPAILGSVVLDAKDMLDASEAAGVSFGTHFASVMEGLGGTVTVLVGVATAAICGFLAIKFMLFLIRRVSLNWFALYTGLLGAITIVWQMING